MGDEWRRSGRQRRFLRRPFPAEVRRANRKEGGLSGRRRLRVAPLKQPRLTFSFSMGRGAPSASERGVRPVKPSVLLRRPLFRQAMRLEGARGGRLSFTIAEYKMA